MNEKYRQPLSGFFMQGLSACVMEEEGAEEGSEYERASVNTDSVKVTEWESLCYATRPKATTALDLTWSS
jgi:hypothetical protein